MVCQYQSCLNTSKHCIVIVTFLKHILSASQRLIFHCTTAWLTKENFPLEMDGNDNGHKCLPEIDVADKAIRGSSFKALANSH